MKDKKFLITGVSSGLGRALTIRLIEKEAIVWGVARRKELLESLSRELNSPNFIFSTADVSTFRAWEDLLGQLRSKKFVPDVVVFNAAILENDLKNGLNIKSTEKMFETNFFGAIRGVSLLLDYVNKKCQFIAISSSSALKGSGTEGVGYAASKAALSTAFESLHQRYKKSLFSFKVVFFGPISTPMNPFKTKTPLTLSEERAVNSLLDDIHSDNVIFYHPVLFFVIFKLIKLLPSKLYFRILTWHELISSNYR